MTLINELKQVLNNSGYDNNRLKHGIGADQNYFMSYHWYRKKKHDMNKFYKLLD